MRADLYLTSHGLCESRTRAKRDIESGRLYVNGKAVKRCAFDIRDGDTVELRGEEMPFVSRGGLKLLGAIKAFGLDVSGLIAVDIGASTGGFTDCLLQNGAKRVYAVDCGRDQLHERLKNDDRVVSIEGFNARELTAETLGEKCDMAVMDVSFISQTLLYGAVKSTVRDGGYLVSLIKPQFEAGRAALGRGGIVKDEGSREDAVKKVLTAATENGLGICGLERSPITGGDGNIEYIALFKVGRVSEISVTDGILAALADGKSARGDMN